MMVVALSGVSTLHWSSVSSPQGTCVILATERGICWLGTPGTPLDMGLNWIQRKMTFASVSEDMSVEPLRQAVDHLGRYFAGEHIQFTCPLDLHGTPFQLKVWNALTRIPYGETRSYAEIAREIEHPSAVRAVGAANGANPVAIIVPCHRVIGSNGSLTGYGGGLPTKAWLLALETGRHGEG
ncbi:MAG TPA: methylated-DNA--[protein]-cysteine S-methyltransferase [Ktedonobacteraceae bacterium]|nr:methylated-DNA--[protein]-cysteine S-methyltransferase [Ktedonobacteraceae bacterium]